MQTKIYEDRYTLETYVNLMKRDWLLENYMLTDEQLGCEVEHLTFDSQDVKPGTLFVVKGVHFKAQYLKDAIDRGAFCYISERIYTEEEIGPAANTCGVILVHDIRRAMASLGNLFYEEPWRELNLIGITGTKGKSTTTYFLRQILDLWAEKKGEVPSAVVSGIETYDGVEQFESHLTTPEAIPLLRHFRNAVDSRIDCLTMEVSSQALKYHRVDGITFDYGVFLNIGEDHISDNEHRDFDDYFESKLQLFSQSRTAVVNLHSDHIEEIACCAECCKRVLTFGTVPEAVIWADHIRRQDGLTKFTVHTPLWEQEMALTIPGRFNVDNALAAITVAADLGVDPQTMAEALLDAKVSGRMEVYENKERDVTVLVDYAHNRLSFEQLYTSTVSEYSGKKIVGIFGCPGGKAQARRQELPEVAGKYAAKIYVTEEDPGEEDLAAINAEIAANVKAQGCDVQIIADREECIRTAIEQAEPGTVILLTGKGRETRQKRGTRYEDVRSDVDLVKKYL
ncbi:MAG: UDP-N-acetylmuramyl-tripeptide synthetase [Firmicutes bacterium]|nr:UDP-N-acetylmuramyl-tripeptide synthetase [Bacillota bacterium]